MEDREIEVYIDEDDHQAIIEFSMGEDTMVVGLPVEKVRNLRRKLEAAEYQLEGELKEFNDEAG